MNFQKINSGMLTLIIFCIVLIIIGIITLIYYLVYKDKNLDTIKTITSID
jgi:Tfp pilus assembly protein PilE